MSLMSQMFQRLPSRGTQSAGRHTGLEFRGGIQVADSHNVVAGMWTEVSLCLSLQRGHHWVVEVGRGRRRLRFESLLGAWMAVGDITKADEKAECLDGGMPMRDKREESERLPRGQGYETGVEASP